MKGNIEGDDVELKSIKNGLQVVTYPNPNQATTPHVDSTPACSDPPVLSSFCYLLIYFILSRYKAHPPT